MEEMEPLIRFVVSILLMLDRFGLISVVRHEIWTKLLDFGLFGFLYSVELKSWD
jgi:hypothetical protein